MAWNRGHFVRGYGTQRVTRFKEEARNLERTTIPPHMLVALLGTQRRIRTPCSSCSLARTPFCPLQQGGDATSCTHVGQSGER